MKLPLIPLLVLGLTGIPFARAQNALPNPTSEAAVRTVIDLSASGIEKLAVPSHPQVTAARALSGPGIDIAVAPGPAAFPGVSFTPADGVYDLSGTGYIEAKITNTGTGTILVSLRIDNAGDWKDNPWNGASAYLPAGKTGTARIYYGISYNQPAYAIDPAKITKIIAFTGKSETASRTFRIESITAGGNTGDKPPTNPDLARVKPKNGVIFGAGATFDATKQIVARGGAKAEPAKTGPATANLGFTGAGQSVLFRTEKGYWDLGDFLQVRVRVKNTGGSATAPAVQLTSREGASDFGVADRPVQPGATADIVVSFIPKTPTEIESSPDQESLGAGKHWGLKDTPGSRFLSHQTNGVIVTAGDGGKSASLQILSITAELPPPAAPPAWLGQRPPVAGDWVKTFEENFDGTALNTQIWGTYASNWWDQRVGFSKDNVILKGDGFGRLRIEKRDGHHNDDPAEKATSFATGWLDTYGKWTQRYGYYEARVKLPAAPSMFPGFWLMPDHGESGRHRNHRSRTTDGGMEFDIFEGQSMWGPYRTTFGMHWDGYAKNHKAAGSLTQYNPPDKDGFLTIGMLWLPGHVSVYTQGRKGGSWDSPRIGSVQSFIILDLLPGGFQYDPLDPATLPADLVIDYIRVWQRKDLATPGDGFKR
jgi:beta-glucanase (GH16 family)